MAVFDLPSSKFVECTFTLLDGVTSSPFDRGMSFNLTQVTDPVWRAHVETWGLDRPEKQVWSAWKHSLRGGLNRIRAYDIARSAPLAYRNAKSPAEISSGWNGAGTVNSLGAAGALTVSGLPTGYQALPDDRVGIEQNGRYGYYAVLQPATANGSGVISLTVAPFLHTSYFSSGAVARLWRPMALFVIDWKTWSLSETRDLEPASFDAYQVLR
ncbi:hypothetical protein [Rhizobium sp. LC145]|uniref:hypothetical protein n=1 Tax=Rhizobium sp. LC145 TaxID=1120688 RepID=UPI00062A4C98|nr:hypothetical protein [Rhizobium sp. LC145]KKX25288.1 hypothetical protein YH62_25395 [Rhizobium sp. LC145]TKT45308.1 hypothetical protein FDR95_25555 [Rhizobiaceae bacterium LC148]